ncbi:apoptosis-inducing factor 3-like [Oppia nitens]|uniref:apoptosis-inducing factor 3-like n=1 Tax=Oppia nitens TaxID=1686743 RepID=UPI0023DCAD0A|nr:apoptosis-inducing factor 3-like [Oppia nitens]
MGDIVEQIVCKTSDLQNNEKRVFDLAEDGGKVLVIKQDDKFMAIGHKCSHYGAPLVNGVLCGHQLSCPWHAATFNIITGDIEDFPGCDSLPVHEVIVKGDNVMVRAKKADLKQSFRVKSLSPKNDNNVLTFVIVGGGPAGLQCAETLRQEGFTGRVVLISSEDSYPYDRTKLSKTLTSKVKDLLLRSEDFLNKANIEVILNATVEKLNTKEKSIQLDNGSVVNFDRIFLGTGVRPKTYDAKGNNLKNICYLRTHLDANFIAENGPNKDVVIIGTSFIGMEVAAYLNGKAKSLSIIGKSKYPFALTLGQQIGEQFRKLYESKGIKFYTECGVKEFCGDNDNQLKTIILTNDEVLNADLCVIGIGGEPNTDYLKGTDIKMDKSYILVDKNFETSEKNVFAGGDVVRYELSIVNQSIVNVGHWQTAQSHGKSAALSMLVKTSDLKSVPFFWSMMFGKGLRFAGNNEGFKDIIIDGNVEEFKFIAYYIDNAENVVAVATIANDPIATLFTAFLRSGKTLTAKEIKSDPKAWIKSMSGQPK